MLLLLHAMRCHCCTSRTIHVLLPSDSYPANVAAPYEMPMLLLPSFGLGLTC